MSTFRQVEFSWPTFSYWVKAGIAFTLGAGVTTLLGVMISWVLMYGMLASTFSRHVR